MAQPPPGRARRRDARPLESGPVSKIDPEPRPIRYLREYSNFLTPKVGALTADTWAFVGIYLRNLLLNWGVFLPLFLAVLMLPRMVLTYTLYQPIEGCCAARGRVAPTVA